MPRNRQGFTLVELSIVLIIIALLVGGLLGMRSYMNNARINNTMNEAKYYISAVNQFQTRYNALPGDYTTASSAWKEASSTGSTDGTNHNGDGNGLIRAAGTAVPLERYYLFQHLALAGFIQGSFTGAVNGNGGATIGLNVPGASVDKAAFLFDHPDNVTGNVSGETQYFDSSTAGLYGNVLIIATVPSDTHNGVPNAAFLTPKQALQVDEKHDDAQPGRGNVMVSKSNTACYTSDTAYDTGDTNANTKNCYLILRFQ